jgi:poly-gamma-glutamate synthesis protein (capsule biosynthesis protein)
MTGTTALTRGTALLMKEKGIQYPALDIGQLLSSVDITHISHEVSFNPECPEPSEKRKGVRFCSLPADIQLLELIGADVIELTGNHLNDWGREALVYTLGLYQDLGMLYYGGGLNSIEAKQTLTLEKNGNRLAFIGCNVMGPRDAWASDRLAGSARCDYNWIESEVTHLIADSYVVVVTLQHFEVDQYLPQSSQKVDFLRMSQAGAAIVSGSQAHFPQIVTFVGDHFIHYGLGNLFFDQMTEENRRAFIDIHSIYQGRLISTELITIMMEDAGKPRFMTLDERQLLFSDIFSANGW